jgi:SAM-dependent methyltransferase
MIQDVHEILPTATHDEFAREEFCGALRRLFTTELWPGYKDIYYGKMLPAFRERHGRDPEAVREVSELMSESFYARGVSLLGRTAQEMLWDTVGESIERQLDTLIDKAKPRGDAKGTVALHPEMEIPKYIEAVDIHAMPGNFQTELCADDVFAGALYDRGVHVFAYGGLGSQNQGLGVAVAEFLKARFPDLAPRRILDIGCGPGFTTLPLVDAYPDAEVYGIDVGAPMIRYAHRRAESLGKRVHYSQQNGADTDFPDNHFDVVYSMLVNHECPVPVTEAIFKEAHRILRPGGILLQDGAAVRREMDPFSEYMNSWFMHNVNEPFSASFRKLDFPKAFENAGFPAENLFSGQREAVYLKGQLPPVSFVGSIKE